MSEETERRALILDQMRLFQSPVDKETLRAALMLQDDLRATQALLNLMHRGEIVARIRDDQNSVDDIQFLEAARDQQS